MVPQYHPWRHESELALVRDWIFPGHVKTDVYATPTTDMRQRGVEKVNLWLFKAGSLPPALVATASLTEALLHDERGRGKWISETAVQSIYAMAFARFVNSFVDRDVARSLAAEMAVDANDNGVNGVERVKGSGESSMYAHAQTIGMPERFVDLRHQVTHGQVPSVRYLRNATLQALEWLWEKWWMKNATGEPDRALREIEERRMVSQQAKELAVLGSQAELHLQGGDTAETNDLRKAASLDLDVNMT